MRVARVLQMFSRPARAVVLVYLIFTFTLIFKSYDHTEAALTRRPSDSIVTVGRLVVLYCSTDLTEPLYWARRLHGSDDIDVIFQADTLVERHIGRLKVVKDDRGAFDLHILNVTLQEAGNYYCVDDDNAYKPDGQDKQHIELTVVVGDFNCFHNILQSGMIAGRLCQFDFPPDTIHINCCLSIAGKLTPNVQISQQSHEHVLEHDLITTFGGRYCVSSSVTVTEYHDRSNFKAKITNIHALREWESPQIIVLHLEGVNYTQNSRIGPVNETCEIKTNLLTPDILSPYRWVKSGNGEVQVGNTLVIKNPGVSDEGDYDCYFQCDIRNYKCRQKLKSINVKAEQRPTTPYIGVDNENNYTTQNPVSEIDKFKISGEHILDIQYKLSWFNSSIESLSEQLSNLERSISAIQNNSNCMIAMIVLLSVVSVANPILISVLLYRTRHCGLKYNENLSPLPLKDKKEINKPLLPSKDPDCTGIFIDKVVSKSSEDNNIKKGTIDDEQQQQIVAGIYRLRTTDQEKIELQPLTASLLSDN